MNFEFSGQFTIHMSTRQKFRLKRFLRKLSKSN